MTISLGRRLPVASSDLPEGGPRLPWPSYAVLLRAGLAQPAGHPTAGALLPHHFTLTSRRQAGGGLFLWRFPEGHPYWELPSALSRWSSDFPRPPVFKRPRPPGHLAHGDRTPAPRRVGTEATCSVWLFTVEGGVRQRIRAAVLLARDVVNAEPNELIGESVELSIEGLEPFVAHAIAPLKLPHDQLGVEPELKLGGAKLKGGAHSSDGSTVLGFVIGPAADRLCNTAQLVPVVVEDDGAASGRAWITARGAVGVSDQAHARQPRRTVVMPSSRTMTRSTSSRSVDWRVSNES